MTGYDWNFEVFLPYAWALARGTLVSIELAFLSSLFGTILGALLAIPLRWPIIGPILEVINDTLRAIPMIVLLLLFYFFPSAQLLGLPAFSPFWAATAALTLAQANFTAEIVRTAMDAVPQSLLVSARALGLRESVILVRISGPHVVRQILPTMVAFYIGNLKLSSLASVIGTEELVYVAGLVVSSTYRSIEAWVLVAIIYIILVTPCTMLARRLERSEWMKRR